MSFVQRDDSNKIIGVFRQPQPGYAEEELADDNGEVVAFLNPPASTEPIDWPITMRQLRLGLKRFGDKPASFIQDTIDAIPDGDAKDEAQIWYEETSVVHWDHPQTQALLTLTGIPANTAKAMWMAAKDIA